MGQKFVVQWVGDMSKLKSDTLGQQRSNVQVKSSNLMGMIEGCLKEAVGHFGLEGEVCLEHPLSFEHGDYSTNVAMTTFEKFKINSPQELAEEIKKRLSENQTIGKVVDRIEVAAPGFINFWIRPEIMACELAVVTDLKERYGSSDWGKGRRVVVEYSSPNIAKPFGIGHLRSTIIGQAVYNLYSFLGWEVVGDNHVGDWGTQFGRLLYQIISHDIDPHSLDIDSLEKLYVEFNKEVAQDPTLNDQARLWFKKLEDGDSQARSIWEVLTTVSFKEYARIYNMLDVHIENVYGEGFYEPMLEGVVEEARARGVAVESQGALIIEYPDGMTPGILLKSDGASTYLTRDLATIKFRQEKWNPDLVVYEVGAEQSLHFQQVFAAAKLLGWGGKTHFYHLKHGLYLGASGKKFSTRRGETIHLDEVLEEAIGRADRLASGPAPAGSEGTRAPISDLSRMVGIGAVKYFDLSHNPASDIVFDWEKVMALDGNSAPYIQYTFARTQSVLEKANRQSGNQRGGKQGIGVSEDLSEEELSLLRTFYKFPEVVERAAREFSPNVLANFLFDLAQKYNGFYNKHRILQAEGDVKEFRLTLTDGVGVILKRGLNLLGIEAPEKM